MKRSRISVRMLNFGYPRVLQDRKCDGRSKSVSIGFNREIETESGFDSAISLAERFGTDPFTLSI